MEQTAPKPALISAAEFAQAVASIKRSGDELNGSIQVAAVAAIGFSIVDRNATPACQLLAAMPRGTRRDALVKFLETHGNLAYFKSERNENQKFKFCENVNVPQTFTAERRDALMQLKWYDAKKETAPKSIYDVAEEFDKFIDRLKRLAKEGKIAEEQAGLARRLQILNAEIQAEAWREDNGV